MLKSTFNFTGLAVAVALAIPSAVQAQTVFEENFEGVEVPAGEDFGELTCEGWEMVDRVPNDVLPHRWCIYNSGQEGSKNKKAWVDAKWLDYSGSSISGSDYLLTPWFNVDGPTSITFTWAASAQALDAKEFDLRVRVIEEGQEPNHGDFIFSILDPAMVLESGVQPTDYGWYTVPWVGWAKNVSTLDLSDWEGKKVRVSFEYWVNGTSRINSMEIDDVKVYRSEAINGPVASPSITEWNFGNVYVGSKMLSEIFTLTNKGKGELKVTGIEAPEGYDVLSAVPFNELSLKKNESVNLQLVYDASMTSAASGNLVIKTNGEDATIAVRASKQMLPEGYTFEGFEGTTEIFPPAGWKVNGDWRSNTSPIEGFLAAWSMADFEATPHELITPRLDGSKGELTFEFDYYDLSSDESGMGCDNTVNVYFSKDGGQSWNLLTTYDYNGPYNDKVHQKFTQTTDGSDNCYFKISYMPLEEYDTEYGPEVSRFYVDAVILPPLYGVNAAPSVTELTSPADATTNLYPKNITLTWRPAQFANGYRVYVGSNESGDNLVNGVDVKEALQYTIASANYETTYNWRIEAYNEKGATPSATYTFTTQPDASVKVFPWTENFETDVFPPIGWIAENDKYTKWQTNSIAPFEGKISAGVQAGLEGEVASLVTPDIQLPAEPSYLSFYWGDAPGIALKVDDLGTRVNPTNGSNGIADLDLQIFVDGQWIDLAKLSDQSEDEDLYWYRERIDLTPYAGKTIQLRWKRSIFDYTLSRTASLDKIAIEPILSEKLSLNFNSWDALKVNYNESAASGSIFSLLNDGNDEAEIATIQFSGTNFTTTLKPGDKIAAGSGIPFAMAFQAGTTSAKVNETMTITTVGGASVTMNLTGEGMPIDTRFYGFEQDECGSLQPKDFITVDEDGLSTIQLVMVTYPNYGRPMAFEVMNYKKVDWPNPYPNTGDQNIVSFATNDNAKDWIIMPNLNATENSSFEFWGRNYERFDPNFEPAFKSAVATVLVSEAEDPRDLSQYESLASYTLNCPKGEEYTKYETRLGAYANKKIHVAMRSTVNSDGLAYLYDDFTFSHFNFDLSGISNVVNDNFNVRVNGSEIMVDGVEAALLDVYNMAGIRMASAQGNALNVSALPAGVYLLKVTADDVVKTMRFVKR